MIPPSFVGLFNRRLTTNEYPVENCLTHPSSSSFQIHFNEENSNHRQRPVSVITLSSDEDDEQPPPRFHLFSFKSFFFQNFCVYLFN